MSIAPKSLTSRTLLGLVAICGVAIIATATVAETPAPAHSPTPRFRRSTQLPGVAACEESVDVATLVAGNLAEIHVKEGEWVRAGQTLAVLANSIPKAALEMARATAGASGTVKAAKVDLQIASNRVRRVNLAMGRGASSNVELEAVQAELDRAIAAYEMAKDGHNQAKARLAMAEAELDTYTLRAPFDGRVVHIKKKIGKTLQENEPVIQIVNMETLRVELYLPSTIRDQLTQGESYLLKADKPIEKEIKAKLRYASPTIDSATRSIRCVFEIDNTNMELPAGFHVVFSLDQLEPNEDSFTSVTP